jgi:hypothetical protein
MSPAAMKNATSTAVLVELPAPASFNWRKRPRRQPLAASSADPTVPERAPSDVWSVGSLQPGEPFRR